MKYIFLIIVCISVLAQTISKTLILANHRVNKDYISRNLCEKKKVKNNKCQGSCHLKKQFQKTEKQEEKSPAPLKDTLQEMFCDHATLFSFTGHGLQIATFPVLRENILISSRTSVDHPPQIV